MVFKHRYALLAGALRFENDVKTYGIQTLLLSDHLTPVFENDVKTYGIQTINC